MKTKPVISFIDTLLCVVVLFVIASCSTSGEDRGVIERSAGELNTEFRSTCADTPFLESVAFTAAGDDIHVDLVMSGDAVTVPSLSESLVQYALAIYMKGHTGSRLDNLLNALGRLDGKMVLTLTDCDGESRTYEIAASRLKQLVRLRPMELNFTEVRTAVLDIMRGRCNDYRIAAGASDASFGFSGGFAEYTLAFGCAADYRQFNRANLAGRYVGILQPRYAELGALRPYVLELMRSLQIDGYRFVYTAPDAEAPLRSAIPWRLLD